MKNATSITNAFVIIYDQNGKETKYSFTTVTYEDNTIRNFFSINPVKQNGDEKKEWMDNLKTRILNYKDFKKKFADWGNNGKYNETINTASNITDIISSVNFYLGNTYNDDCATVTETNTNTQIEISIKDALRIRDLVNNTTYTDMVNNKPIDINTFDIMRRKHKKETKKKHKKVRRLIKIVGVTAVLIFAYNKIFGGSSQTSKKNTMFR